MKLPFQADSQLRQLPERIASIPVMGFLMLN